MPLLFAHSSLVDMSQSPSPVEDGYFRSKPKTTGLAMANYFGSEEFELLLSKVIEKKMKAARDDS